MEKNIDDFLNDISEAKDKFEATPGFKLSEKEAKQLATRLAKIVEFENFISDVKNVRLLIKDLKRYQEKGAIDDLKSDDDEDEEKGIIKIDIPKSLLTKLKEVEKILDSKSADELTSAETKKIESFTDSLAYEFKKLKMEVPSEYPETGTIPYKAKLEQAFPVRLEIGKANYYGLVRPPTGIITWQGATARQKAAEIGVPVKMPIMNTGDKKSPVFKVKRGADAFGKFMSKFQDTSDIDFDFDDSDEAKNKVMDSLEKAGATIRQHKDWETKGSTKGVEDAIANMKLDDMIDESLNPEERDLAINEGLTKNVVFWKNIAQIF